MDKIIIDAERKINNGDNATSIINELINELTNHVADIDKQVKEIEDIEITDEH